MKLKKLLSAIIVGAMVLGTMSILAFAADGNVAKIGDTEYASLADALEAASDTEATTITLIDDATTDAFTIDKPVNIDLGGKTLTFTYRDSVIKSTVEIYNGKIYCADFLLGNSVINVGFTGIGSLTMKNVDITAKNLREGTGILQVYSGALALDNVNITATGLSSAYTLYAMAEASATIKNSTVTVTDCPRVLITNNTATATPGGLFNFDSIENCVISLKNIGGNAVRNAGDIEIKNSQITVDGCENGIKLNGSGKVENSVIDVKNATEKCFIFDSAIVDNKSVLTSSDDTDVSYSNKADVLVSTQNIANAAESDTENSTVGFATTIAPKSAATVLKGVRWTVTAKGITKTKEFGINNISGQGTTKLGLIITNINDANATATAEAITK